MVKKKVVFENVVLPNVVQKESVAVLKVFDTNALVFYGLRVLLKHKVLFAFCVSLGLLATSLLFNLWLLPFFAVALVSGLFFAVKEFEFYLLKKDFEENGIF